VNVAVRLGLAVYSTLGELQLHDGCRPELNLMREQGAATLRGALAAAWPTPILTAGVSPAA
jgi:hypothetical protein